MVEQHIRICLLYEFKLRHKASVATKNINLAWGDGSVSESSTERYFKKFKSGNISMENDDRGRPPTTVSNDHLKEVVEADTRKSTRELAVDLNVSKSTISRHLQELGKVKKLDKWIPYDLNEKQQLCRFEISSSLILRNRNDPFLSRIVTCDEKWLLYDNRRRSAQWLDADEKPKHMPKPSHHPKRTMITVWWSAAGLIHYSFLPTGETITAQSYCKEIEIMHHKLLEKQPALVNRRGPILLHDNAKPHISRLTAQKLNGLNYEVLPHPAYSPDLSPSDYYLFKHMDRFLTNKKFRNQIDIQNDILQFFESRSGDFYEKGIYKLLCRWQKCVDNNGQYFDE